MTSGIPLTSEQKQKIIENKDTLFISQIAKDCDCSRDAVRNYIKKVEKKEVNLSI